MQQQRRCEHRVGFREKPTSALRAWDYFFTWRLFQDILVGVSASLGVLGLQEFCIYLPNLAVRIVDIVSHVRIDMY